MASQFNRAFSSQGRRLFNSNLLYWAFPVAAAGSWIIYPALNYDFKLRLGLEPDPEREVKLVQDAYNKRLEAFKAMKVKPGLKAAVKDDDEVASDDEEAAAADEEEEEGTPADEEEEDVAPAVQGEEEAPPADEEEEEGAGGDAEEEESEEEDDEEEEEIQVKPLYTPVKGQGLSKFEMWDNFNIKSVMFNEDDEDEDEDDE